MFDLDTFVADPTVKELERLRKSDIVQIAKHYTLETKTNMVKHTLFNIVAQHIVDEQLGGDDFKGLELNLGQETRIKMRELEIRTKELEIQSKQEENKEKELALEHEKLTFQR